MKRDDKLSIVLFVMAVACSVAAVMNGIADPWEHGFRGINGGQFAQGSVHYHMAYGLAQTGGYPVVMIEQGDHVERLINWHHPATYWLWMTAVAACFGNTAFVLRLAHLPFWLPAMFALRSMVMRRFGAQAGNCAALLFATTPMLAYYGPMVVQDGATVGMGLVALDAFDRWIRDRKGWAGVAAAMAFFLCCLIDFQGYWWGVSMFCLACGKRPLRATMPSVVIMACVSIAALAVVAVHYGWCMGGPWSYISQVLSVVGAESKDSRDISWESVRANLADVLLTHGNLPIVLLGLVGVMQAIVSHAWRTREFHCLMLALAVPGILACGTMPKHALEHVFWSMHGFAVFAAAGGCLAAHSRLRSVAFVAVCSTAVWGAWKTHQLIESHRTPESGVSATLMAASEHLQGCTWTFTNLPATGQTIYRCTWVIAGIDTPEALAACVAFARSRGLKGELGFVLGPADTGGRLAAVLAEFGSPIIVGDSRVFRFRP